MEMPQSCIKLFMCRQQLKIFLYMSKIANRFSIEDHFLVDNIDGLMQERRNSIANGLELGPTSLLH